MPEELLVVDPERGEMEFLAPDEEPGDLEWGTAVAGEGGVLFVLQTSAENGRVVEIFPDDRSTRVVVGDTELASAGGIAVVSGRSGANIRVNVSCGLGFELALVLPALMALRRRRRGR